MRKRESPAASAVEKAAEGGDNGEKFKSESVSERARVVGLFDTKLSQQSAGNAQKHP
jgi:hypothetical protein